MNDNNARIDQVLQRLRKAEPAEGLEQRVLCAIQEQAPGATHTRRAGIRQVFPLASRWSAIAAAVLAGTLLFWSVNRPTRHQEIRRDRAGLAHRPEPAIKPPPPVHLAAIPTIPRPQSSASANPSATLPPKGSGQGRTRQADVFFSLANHPAPEAPLTDEERLLLRIAHRGAPEQFAVLNPDARDAQAKSDRADFQRFFGPPPPPGDSE